MKSFNLKKLSVLLVSLFLPVYLTAQIRDYVGIVEEHYHPEIISFLEDFRDELSQNGYKSYGKLIDAYLAGGFGSGFVYVASDGTNYIITNRHVVNQAATVTVKFEDDETGKIVQYDDLTVAALDDDIDLAILKFKGNEKPFKSGIPISQKKVADGQDVWSAGFPALGDEPVWQLGKGTVTNSRARIKELIDPSISTIIQHSAEIDSGNSGGPLLISANNSVGYEVVGVNTWKAAYRQNTNFAIPATLISQMISKASSNGSSDLTDAQTCAEKIIAALNNAEGDFTVLSKYVSEELTLARGRKDFVSTLKFAPSDVRSIVADAFAYAPIEGMRYSVAYQLWKKFSVASNEGKTISRKDSNLNGEVYEAVLSINENDSEAKLVISKEKGLWRIKNLAFDGDGDVTSSKSSAQSKSTTKSSSSTKSSSEGTAEKPGFFTEISSDADLKISVGPVFYAKEKKFSGIAVEGDYFGGNYFGYNLFVDGYKFYESTTAILGGGIIGRLPINFNDAMNLDFSVKAGPCVNFRDGDTFIGFNASAGVSLTFTKGLSCMPGIGVSYVFMKLKDFGLMHKDIERSELRIYGSIAFNL